MALFKDRMGKELSLPQAIKKILLRLYSYILDFELFIVTCVGQIPCHLFRLWCYQLDGMKVGKGSRIHMWARFYQLKNITLGEDSVIGDHAFLDGRDIISIGNHVNIASQTLIYNSQHDIDAQDFRATTGAVIIEDYVFIGPRVTILPKVTIGKGAVVAAGAVVTKDVAPFTVVGGVPAVYIRDRKLKDPQYRIGRARLFQ